jgi:hypothetical protein
MQPVTNHSMQEQQSTEGWVKDRTDATTSKWSCIATLSSIKQFNIFLRRCAALHLYTLRQRAEHAQIVIPQLYSAKQAIYKVICSTYICMYKKSATARLPV